MAVLLLLPIYGTVKGLPQRLVPNETVERYMTTFNDQEVSATGQASTVKTAWFDREIPRVDLPEKSIEEMYYFRWFSFAKHLKQTPRGWVITEFLEDVPWVGKYNTISAAAGMHLREARWLRDPSFAEQAATFWSESDAEPRRYSFPYADSVHALTAVTGDMRLEQRMLTALISNYKGWQAGHRDANGLFWQIDDRDGMEFSAGGSGFRPTINSYMYADAVAISQIAIDSGHPALGQRYSSKADDLAQHIHSQLWNPQASFYETLGPSLNFSGTRELIGYLPWYFGVDRPSDERAWLQIVDPQGFLAPYGYTTTERRSISFMHPYSHECTWNGPVWPFAMTQTLTAMANMLNRPGSHVLPASAFLIGLRLYVREQRLTLPDGKSIPWIDEDSDPDSGEWIARSTLRALDRPDQRRGAYYNHSGFADLIISCLIGLRPDTGPDFTLAPLVDPAWNYFALEDVPYHGHLLSIYYDRDGTRYNAGKGLTILRDGEALARSATLKPMRLHVGANRGEDRRPAALNKAIRRSAFRQ